MTNPINHPPGAGGFRIRLATPSDLETLGDLERAAGECFRDIGMAQIADDEPLPIEALADHQRAGRAYVTIDGPARVVVYLIWDLVDGNLHVEQVSVHPDAAGHGLGRSLIEWAAAEAAARGISALTLTTFRDVPWNAPYYARNCGFRIVDDAACGPGLQAIREHEVAHGLDRWPRVCMRRDLAPRG